MMIVRLLLFLPLLSFDPSSSHEVSVGGETFVDVGSLFTTTPNTTTNITAGRTLQGPCLVTLDPRILPMAGRIVPQTFSCSAPRRFVRYVHDGNPYLREEVLHFVVRRFDGRDEQTQNVQLVILVRNIPEVADLPLILASSSTFTKIGSEVIRPGRTIGTHDHHQSSCSAAVRIEPPQAILYHPNATPANVTSLDCHDLPRYLIKLSENGPSHHHMKIVYEFNPSRDDDDNDDHPTTMTTTTLLPVRQSLFVLIQSTRAKVLPNFSPRIRFGPYRSLQMTQYSLLIIHPKTILVTDDSTPTDSITIATSSLDPLEGHLVRMDDKWKPIRSFSYGDLLRRKVAFRAPVRKLLRAETRELCLSARDVQHAESEVLCLSVLIRPASLRAPIVVEKGDVLVPRGASRTITRHHVGLAGSEERAVLQIKEAPTEGFIEIDGEPSSSFDYADIEAGKVVYNHRGGENFEDKIVFKIFSNSGSGRLQLDLKIVEAVDECIPRIAMDQQRPNISTRELQLTTRHFDAVVSKVEEENDELLFVLTTTPRYGMTRRKRGGNSFDGGFEVLQFTMRQLRRGDIFYQVHDVLTNLSGPLVESFELEVRHALIERKKKSARFSLTINIVDLSSSEPQRLKRIVKCRDLTNLTATVGVSQSVRIFTSNDLCYRTDNDGYDDDDYDEIRFVITSPPFVGDIFSDAGAIVERTGKGTTVIDTFNETAIDAEIVAYEPSSSCFPPLKCTPTNDVRFKFSVVCSRCITLYDQMFTLRFPASDDHTSSVIILRLGETKLLNPMLKDAIGDEGETLRLTNNPQFGVLVRDGSVVKVSREWTLGEFLSKNIWYQHSHQICSKDGIIFSTNHSIHRIDIVAQSESHTFPVEFVSNLPQTVLDPASFKTKITIKEAKYEVIRQPQHGRIRVLGRDEVTEFSSEELNANSVYYKMRADRRATAMDSFLLLQISGTSRSDTKKGSCSSVLFDVSLTFSSNIESNLWLSGGSVKIDLDSRSVDLAPHILTSCDQSMHDDDDGSVKFVIVQSPTWGYVVRSSDDQEHETPVSSFTRADLKRRLVRYSLAAHGATDVGSLVDSFRFFITDGRRNSTTIVILVNISLPVRTDDSTIKRRNHRNVNKNISRKSSSAQKEGDLANGHEEHDPHGKEENHNWDRRSNFLHLGVDDIKVPRRGQATFTIHCGRSSQKRRSMTESILSLHSPPVHGTLDLLDVLERSSDIRENFENLSLPAASNEIQMVYRHDGSSSSRDHFVLSLRDDVASIKKVVTVKVEPRSRVELIRKEDLVVVGRYPVPINSSHLLARGQTTRRDVVRYRIIARPRWGVLKILDEHLESGDSQLTVGSSFSQLDVDENRIFYFPLDSSSVRNDSFSFKVDDELPVHTIHVIVPRRVLNPSRLVIDGNSARCLDGTSFEGLDVDEGGVCLFIEINEEPLFGSIGSEGKTRFTRSDLHEGSVCYFGRSGLKERDEEEEEGDAFELVLVDRCKNSTVASRRFVVDSHRVEHRTPRLDASVPLMVVHGERVALGPLNLRASCDGMDASWIRFEVVDPPRHGRLLKDDRPVMEFTQADINGQLISYESSRIDDSMMDYFLFSISQNKTNSASPDLKASFFSILIQPASKTPSQLFVASPHKKVILLDERFVFRIDSSHLKASHSTFSSRELVYHIKSKTKHGHLELRPPGRQVKRKFTQKDVDENKLIYVIRNDSLVTNDTFTFKLVDPNKYTIDNQRFSFEWSVVEFENPHTKVCKGADVVAVSVVRRGLVSETSAVQIKAKYSSDEEIAESFKLSNGTLNFPLGSMKEDWSMKLYDESQFKNGMKIKLDIVNVTGTVIGKTEQTIVHLWDAKAGCSSKDLNTTLESYFEPMDDDFYEDDDYEDVSLYGDDDDDDDYLEADWSYYSDRMPNFDKGSKDDRQTPTILQPCNPSTKSLLFLDVLTSQLFKCNGRYWQKWGWAPDSGGHKMLEKESVEEKSQKTCPLGWLLYGDNCFLSSKVKMTWTEAEETCRGDGGHLTFVLSMDHLTWLSGLTGGSRFWIGLNNRRDASQWEFTGSALFSSVNLAGDTFFNWGPRQPCAKCPRSRCVQASEGLHYASKQCTKNRARFVCTRPSRLPRSSRRVKQKRTGRHHRVT